MLFLGFVDGGGGGWVGQSGGHFGHILERGVIKI